MLSKTIGTHLACASLSDKEIRVSFTWVSETEIKTTVENRHFLLSHFPFEQELKLKWGRNPFKLFKN